MSGCSQECPNFVGPQLAPRPFSPKRIIGWLSQEGTVRRSATFPVEMAQFTTTKTSTLS